MALPHYELHLQRSERDIQLQLDHMNETVWLPFLKERKDSYTNEEMVHLCYNTFLFELGQYAVLDVWQNYRGSSEYIIFPSYKVKYALLRAAAVLFLDSPMEFITGLSIECSDRW